MKNNTTSQNQTSTVRASRLIAGLFYALVIGGVYLTTQVSGQGTLTPTPYQVVSDSSGNPISGAKICTSLSGTATAVATYTNSALTVANTNPIVTDASGRFTAFLTPGVSYRFTYYSNDGTAATCDGTVLKTQDNISAVPTSSNNIDVTGTAGVALTAGEAVYLSNGSGALTAGLWYKADADNTYSSTGATVGIVPSSIAINTAGSIRLSGSVTGLSGLVVGADYYVSAVAGAITSTAPMNARFVGRADTATSLIVVPSSSASTAPNYTAKVTSYTAVAYDLVSVTSGALTIVLPLSASNLNKMIWVANNGLSSVVTVPTGSDTIGLATSQTLNPGTATTQGDAMIFIADGVTNWIIQ